MLAMQALMCVTPKLQGSFLLDYSKAREAVKCAVQELEGLFGAHVSTYGHSPALEVMKKSLVEAPKIACVCAGSTPLPGCVPHAA